MGAALLNSTIITVVSLLVLIVVGSTASYYLARKQSRLSYGMYILFLLGSSSRSSSRWCRCTR